MSSVVETPRVTIAVPSLNQGQFLEATLRSIFSQPINAEVMCADGGSHDESREVIERWRDKLTWWRSGPDAGQAAAINEAIDRGRAPLVCWLNSDDLYLPGGLTSLVEAIEAQPSAAVVYGGCILIDEEGNAIGRYRTAPFSARALSRRSIIAQPAAIIRRQAWERVGGLDESLDLSHDYDLWWRLHLAGERLVRIDSDVAAARLHLAAKGFIQARAMYAEGETVVRRHTGSLPLIWRIRRPFSVHARTGGKVIGRLMARWRRWSAGI